MASVNISIRKEVYEWLEGQKLAGESFSDVLCRLLESRKGTFKALEPYAGIWRERKS